MLKGDNYQVSFIQHDLPGLTAGEYTLHVSQELSGIEKYENEYTISVASGDRFKLQDPGQTIFSVFPGENASGAYNSVLPSVVFTKSVLPWVRSPLTASSKNNIVDKDEPTWLTILLLDDDDIKDFNHITLEPQCVLLKDLLPISESSLGDNYSYFEHARSKSNPKYCLDCFEKEDDAIEVLDIPYSLFRSIAPTIEDLKLMAHIRKVSLMSKATIRGVSDIGESESCFSIVFGNRVPASGKNTHAYLVSLEGMSDFLPSSKKTWDANKNIRLAVLKHWSFFTDNAVNMTFVDRLKRLNNAEASPDIAETTLKLPIAQKSTKEVTDILSMGYTPLNHHLRSGEKNVSWFRGPLAPYRVEENKEMSALSPDSFTIFDPVTGMLDVSYAAAWTLGRLISLRDKSFSVKYHNFIRQKNTEKMNLLEQNLFNEYYVGTVLNELNSENSESENNQSPETLIMQILKSIK